MKVTFNLSRDFTMLFHGSIEEKHWEWIEWRWL